MNKFVFLFYLQEYLELTGGFDDDTSDLFGSRYAPSVSGKLYLIQQLLFYYIKRGIGWCLTPMYSLGSAMIRKFVELCLLYNTSSLT